MLCLTGYYDSTVLTGYYDPVLDLTGTAEAILNLTGYRVTC